MTAKVLALACLLTAAACANPAQRTEQVPAQTPAATPVVVQGEPGKPGESATGEPGKPGGGAGGSARGGDGGAGGSVRVP